MRVPNGSIVSITLLASYALCLCMSCMSCSKAIVSTPTAPPPAPKRCSVSDDEISFLVVDWDAQKRTALEVAAKKGTVVVEYTDCNMKILRQCTAPGEYSYTQVGRKDDQIEIKSKDELYAKVPMGAASLEGKLGKTGRLYVDMTAVGQYDNSTSSVARNTLTGENCDTATHFVSARMVGAFLLSAGAEGEARAKAEAWTAEAGAEHQSSTSELSRDGNRRSCLSSSENDAHAPDGCRSTIGVTLARFRGEKKPLPAGDPSEPVAREPQQTAANDPPQTVEDKPPQTAENEPPKTTAKQPQRTAANTPPKTSANKPPQQSGNTPPKTRENEQPKQSSSAQRTWGWVALGVGSAGIATFGTTGIMTWIGRNDFNDSANCDAQSHLCYDKKSDVDRYNLVRTISMIALPVGVIGVGTGVTLLLTDSSSKESERAEIRAYPWIGLGSAGVRGSF